jgi:arginine/lysine/ornithine decarboxylase
MALRGETLLDRTIALAAAARHRIEQIPKLRVLDTARLGLPADRHDATRLVIDVQGLGLTGIEVERELRRRFGVAPEMSDLVGIVCLVTVGDTPRSIDRLVTALARIAREPRRASRPIDGLLRSSAGAVAAGPQRLTPREAYFAPARSSPLAAAIGKVAAELIVPYPPGIPVLTPGEVITGEKVDYLRLAAAAGIHICGAADRELGSVRVVV